MTDKIVSRPSNKAYRDGWDRIFDLPMHTNVQNFTEINHDEAKYNTNFKFCSESITL